MLIKDLYTVEDFKNADGVVDATIRINKHHDVFKGHFPGNPVMPGVCMIQIIKELTERAVGKDLFLEVSSNIKFMALINPEKSPLLHLNIELSEEGNIVKIKNASSFDDTLALKLNATFKIIGT